MPINNISNHAPAFLQYRSTAAIPALSEKKEAVRPILPIHPVPVPVPGLTLLSALVDINVLAIVVLSISLIPTFLIYSGSLNYIERICSSEQASNISGNFSACDEFRNYNKTAIWYVGESFLGQMLSVAGILAYFIPQNGWKVKAVSILIYTGAYLSMIHSSSNQLGFIFSAAIASWNGNVLSMFQN